MKSKKSSFNFGDILTLIINYIVYIMNDKRVGSIAELTKYHDSNLISITKKAQTEGKQELPDNDSIETMEKQRVKSYETRSLGIMVKLVGFIKVLEDKGIDILQVIENTEYHQLCTQIASSTSDQITLINEDVAFLKGKVGDIKENFRTAKSQCNRPTGKTDGNTFFQEKPVLYYSLLAVVALLECYYSMQAFEHYDLNRYASYSLGATMAIGTFFATHFGGKALKQGKKAIAMTAFGIMIFLGVFPPFMRYEHTKAQDIEYTDNSGDEYSGEEYTYDDEADFDQNTDPYYEESEEENEENGTALQAMNDPLFWTLAAITFSMIFAGFYLSYSTYDSNKEFEECLAELKKLKPKYEKQIKVKKELITKMKKKTRRTITVYKTKHVTDELSGHLEDHKNIVALYNQLVAHYNIVMETAENFAEQAIREYRDENISARKNPQEYPAIWNLEPTITFSRLEPMTNGVLTFFT